jgi:hypothetical protein
MSSETRILIEKEVKNFLDRAYQMQSKIIQFLNASSVRHHGTCMTHEEAPMAVFSFPQATRGTGRGAHRISLE